MYAHTVMRPEEIIAERNPGLEMDKLPTASPDTDLNDLIDIMVNTDEKYIRIMNLGDALNLLT